VITHNSLHRLIVKNAFANLVRLAGAGIVALLLPPFLARELPKDVYGAWALLLQLALYAGYLDFGIQTAVARFVAHANELNDADQRDGIFSTAFALLAGAGLLGCALVVGLAWQIPHIFHQMPAYLYHPAQTALLCMGLTLALGLPANVISALFVGLQRNEVPAAIAIVNKMIMAGLVIAVVLKHWGLAAMGIAVGVANLAAYAGAFATWKAWASNVRLRLALVGKKYVHQIGAYSTSVVVWMLAMLMVSGFDLSIVGIFDYQATAYYAIAATLTTFVAQAQGALFSALLPASAVLAARGEGERLGAMLISATRYGMLILLAMALPLIVAGHWILRLWAGPDYGLHSTVILQVLVIANVIRLCALPYSTLLLGTGQHSKVIASPLAEGVTNLTVSVVGAYFWGAIGVAVGTLIGAFVSIGFHLLYNMPRTALIVIDRVRLIKEGILRPALCALPLLSLSLIERVTAPQQLWIIGPATLGTALLAWNYGLMRSDRQRLAQALRIVQ
jgi:O-antigen/teichoic acid export membrane protein